MYIKSQVKTLIKYVTPSNKIISFLFMHTTSDYEFMILNGKIHRSKNSKDFILVVE